MGDKRNRGKNYLETEKEEFLEIITKYLHIVENKKTDNLSLRKKQHIWEEITNEYNASCLTGARTAAQLKILYDCIKKKARKNRSHDKAELYKNGEGNFQEKSDSIDRKILNMLRVKVEPQDNTHDNNSDWMYGTSFSQVSSLEESHEMVVDFPVVVSPTPENNSEDNIPNISSPDTNTSITNRNKIFNRRKVLNFKKIRQRSDFLKLQILQIQKQKEELMRDKVKLEVEEKKLDIKIKEETLKKLTL